MRLNDEQRTALRDEGVLRIPSLFSPAEVASLLEAAETLVAQDGPHMKREGDTQVRMAFGAHQSDETFARLSRHPRLVEPMEQALGEPVHIFQSRFNVKASFTGGGWVWHQDFNQWYRQDGMRTPRAYAVGIFLDDVNPCNGPLMVIPRSHHDGLLYVPDKMDIPFDLVTRAAEKNGIVPLMGPPGTTVIFHCLIIHGSAPNVSPWPRRIFYLNYIPASIHELQPLRDWYHCDPAVMPLQALPDDCLIAS
jgi:L-proline 4-hydroxylase